MLSIFNPKLPTEVHTDASSAGYGAILLQVHSDGKKHVVAYFSRVTQGAENKYHSYELGSLAVVKALQNFRHYLVGLKFLVVTDCNALKSTEKKKKTCCLELLGGGFIYKTLTLPSSTEREF